MIENDLELALGASSGVEAKVYARLPRTDAYRGAKIRGVLRGPSSRLARTLQTGFRLHDQGDGVAAATVLEPCYWLPGGPYCYFAEIVVTLADGKETKVERPFALAPTGVRDGTLYISGRAMRLRLVPADALSVPEAVFSYDEVATLEAPLLREIPDDAVCRAALEAGLPWALDMTKKNLDILQGELATARRWPNVVAIALGGDLEHVPRSPGSAVLIQDALDASRPRRDWADYVLIQETNASANWDAPAFVVAGDRWCMSETSDE